MSDSGGENGEFGETSKDMHMPTKLYPNLKVEGCAAPDGTLYIPIKHHDEEWLPRRKALLTDAAKTFQSLAEQGIAIGGRAFMAQVLEELHKVRDFPEREILQHPGWSGSIYGRPDGEVLTPAVTQQSGTAPGVSYYRHPNRHSRKGSQKAWKLKVATPLLEDDVATILMGAAIAPVVRPLLSRPVPPLSYQLITDQNCHALRRVALSVVGSISQDSLQTDPVEKLVANPGRYIEASRDSLLVVGDLSGVYGRRFGQEADSRPSLAAFRPPAAQRRRPPQRSWKTCAIVHHSLAPACG